MKNLLLVLFFCLGCGNFIAAQENCAEKLIRANTFFEQGKIDEAIAIAKTCATTSNSVTEKWQAYRILAMSYLINNQPDEARKAAEQMLELNPTYKPSLLKDPKNFIVLLKSISVIPKFSLGLAVSTGANITYPFVTASYNGADYYKTYTTQQSYQFGVLTGYNINEALSVHAGLMASTKKYSIDYTYLNWNFKVSEKISHLEIPCFIRYTFLPKNNLKFYADGGIFGGTLIKSMNTFQRTTLDRNESTIVKNYDATNRRNKMVYGLVMEFLPDSILESIVIN